eukprot:TRINITY_DN7810_c0_g1_i2.p1 TRINITY_DN7810_c0_g1~~TRINITY_DN7810_c0_g1_i2.p1  ORF type:complete len:343 (-),score=81.85 TRINITY_DN7810_c0_g1_i2:181-1209(-)
MWLYAVLFAQSLAETLPLHFIIGEKSCSYKDGLWGLESVCRLNYWAYVLLFAVAMFLVSTQNMASQVGLQKGLSIMAFTCIGVMLLTLWVALGEEQHLSQSRGYNESPVVFDASGFGKAFATFVFAQLAHHGVPGIMELMKDRKSCHWAFLGGVSTTFTVYLVLGVSTALFFGKDSQNGVNKVVTLNWSSYDEGNSVWHNLISYLVRLYPVVSVGAAFPLYADVLGKNWQMYKESWATQGNDSMVAILIRWTSMIPAFIGASLMIDASTIIAIGGLFGFAIELVLPALLQIHSIKACQSRWGDEAANTPYSWHFSQTTYAWGTLVFSAGAFLFSLSNLFFNP